MAANVASTVPRDVMRTVVLTAVALLLVACRAESAPRSPPRAVVPTTTTVGPPTAIPTIATAGPPTVVPTPTIVRAPTVAPTQMPIIDVDEMMGLYPQQTVFVATSDRVRAVTLLNHFTRYQIATGGVAQISSDNTGGLIYLLDLGADGLYQLRAFDVATGARRALFAGISDVAADRRAVATASDGRVLVLKSDTAHAWIDAYDPLGLRLLGPVMDKPGCGDRLLTSAVRIAIVCLATGEVAVDDLRGNRTTIEGALPALVAAAMGHDGALYLATADQQLVAVPAGATQLMHVRWPSEWSGEVMPDGLAMPHDNDSTVVAERTNDGAWLRVFETGNIAHRRSLRLAGPPQGGILTMWPFAYYTVGSTIRHIDLTNGLLETMTVVGLDAVPVAVVNG
jgi:hypothetical protein